MTKKYDQLIAKLQDLEKGGIVVWYDKDNNYIETPVEHKRDLSKWFVNQDDPDIWNELYDLIPGLEHGEVTGILSLYENGLFEEA